MEHLGVLLLLLLTCVSRLLLTEGFPKCSTEQFVCNNGRCVPLNLRCDGVDDCGDSSDEISCLNCTSGSFHCVAAARCVPSPSVCDGKPDCFDGADEQLDTCAQSCTRSQFKCTNGRYGNECEINNGGCSHLCIDLPLGFMCDCPSEMRLVQDTHCQDVDHCLDSDVCDQTCVHTNGSFACECQDGYVLTVGTGQCKATGESTHEGVKWMDLSGSEQRNITYKRGLPGPVSALNANNTLYWTSSENDIIYRMSLDSSDQRPTVLLKASTDILGLAVDWIHELLYWVSTNTHALHVASLNDSKQNSEASPRIERASLDGTSRIALITSSIRYPVAVSLVSRVAFDGQHRKTVVESNGYLDQPYGLAIFESRVYWSDQLTNSICSADKHNGNMLQVSQRLGSVSPAGLVILHPLLQPAVIISLLLVGAVLWWQRSEFCASRSLSPLGDETFKESQDPLLLSRLPVVHEHKDGAQNSSTH
ncbi:Very low-density lipoprotein receptor [Labeo rohita]|uniref:Very low-density lipoprotein receptor n=1 Tax=Labeo rohita TaxID=84645 RepID=A0ABQ8MJ50_LABRO|nr:Very low-density lipoprotein receptor [Labeo rohita]